VRLRIDEYLEKRAAEIKPVLGIGKRLLANTGKPLGLAIPKKVGPFQNRLGLRPGLDKLGSTRRRLYTEEYLEKEAAGGRLLSWLGSKATGIAKGLGNRAASKMPSGTTTVAKPGLFSPLMNNQHTKRIITNAGVGAGIGAVGGAATTGEDGSIVGGAVRGGLLGGLVGGGVGYGRGIHSIMKTNPGRSTQQAFYGMNKGLTGTLKRSWSGPFPRKVMPPQPGHFVA